MINRRQFSKGIVSLAFSGLATHLSAKSSSSADNIKLSTMGYGELIPDPNGILDLPSGFSYQILSQLGDTMSDGFPVPNRADGMGCIAIDDERVVLIRNHEMPIPKESKTKKSPFASVADAAYDVDEHGNPLKGGTTSIIYNLKTQKVEAQYLSLIGTVRNCSGGTTPWGTWLSCEESVVLPGKRNQKAHGYVFEVPSSATNIVDPKPLTAMGRFNHEAACVDPRTGIVYLTEDRNDSLFYRFIPNKKGQLSEGGRLQALVIKNRKQFDTRNWDAQQMTLNIRYQTEWVDLEDVNSPNDDLRMQGYDKGAALFARGEGIYFDNHHLYFCCTNGGTKKLGQIMRYSPSAFEGTNNESTMPGELSLFVESQTPAEINFGDNLAVGPHSHLFVCEDQYTKVVKNKVRGVTPSGDIYNFANVRWQTEPAGVCFSPDNQTLFINLYAPATTLAITGPWDNFQT